MKWVALVLVSLLVTVSLFLLQLISHGARTVTPLTTIHGIVFSEQKGTQIITEALAHADVLLQEPVVAKKLVLHVTFSPGNVRRLSVGVRENSFWLSYPPATLFDGATDHNSTSRITRTVIIPLTDKLQDQNRSVDLLFFAGDLTNLSRIDQRQNDTTEWRLESLSAEVLPAWPTPAALKDYVRGIIRRERPL